MQGGLRLGTWQGELQASFDGQEQTTRFAGGPETQFSLRRLRERLNIRNQGFSVLDPRLLTGNAGLTYDLVHDRQESDGVATTTTGKLTGYSFDATVLGQMPYNATVFANRSQNFLTQPFGGRSDLAYENRGVVLRLREDSFLRERGILPYFSASLRAYQEQNDELTTIAGQSFRRDDLRDVITLEARNGFETADLEFRYESTDFRNRVFAPGTYQSDVVNVNYSGDFGPTLNRRWDSRIFYSNRTGATAVRFVNVDEQVRIAHHKKLSTTWRYVATEQEVASGTTTSQGGVFQLQHRLYDNLTTNLEASELRQRLPDGTRETAYGQAGFLYRRNLPDNAQVFASLGGRYQRDDNQLQASLIQVIDEPHAAPPVLGGGAGFLLNQRFVDVATIGVVDTRGGARLPTSPGIDYVVVAEGDLTRIVPLATSAVIQPNDPLAVTYTYEVDPSLRYATTAHWWGAGADFGWVAFSAAGDKSKQEALSGRDSSFLEDRRKDETQVEFRGRRGDLQARAGANYVRYRATRLAYDGQRYSQSIRYRPNSGFALRLSAQQYSTDYELPVRHSQGYSAELTLDWFAPGGLLVTTYFARSNYRDTELPADDKSEANLKVRRYWRKLEFISTIGRIHRTRGTVDTTDERIMLTATRRF